MVITCVENVLTKKSVFLCGLRNLFKNFQLFIYSFVNLFIYLLYTNNGKQLRGCKKSWREKNQVPSDIALYNDYIILLLHICIICTIGCAENIVDNCIHLKWQICALFQISKERLKSGGATVWYPNHLCIY